MKFDFVDDEALTGCYEIKKILGSTCLAMMKKNKYKLCPTTAGDIDKYETENSSSCSVMLVKCNRIYGISLLDMEGQCIATLRYGVVVKKKK